jgi:MFS family permease
MKNKVFLSLCLALSGLYFVVTGVQFWTPDYLLSVIEISPETESIFFSITSLSAPAGGVIVGGIIMTASGGYSKVKSMKILIVMALGCVMCALPIPFINKGQFWLIALLFWFMLFFGGFILPPLTGLMIQAVPNNQRASANSIANIAYNLLGYLPAPSVYGAVSEWTGGVKAKSRWGMVALMYSTLLTGSLMLYGLILKIKEQMEFETRERNASLKIQRPTIRNNEQPKVDTIIEEEDLKEQLLIKTNKSSDITVDQTNINKSPSLGENNLMLN